MLVLELFNLRFPITTTPHMREKEEPHIRKRRRHVNETILDAAMHLIDDGVVTSRLFEQINQIQNDGGVM